jgi:hypothetical protein
MRAHPFRRLVPSLVLPSAFLLVVACTFSAGDHKEQQQPAAASGGPARGMAQDGQLPFMRDGAGASPHGGGSGDAQLSWETPAGWQSVPPANSMRKAQYVVPSEGGADPGECVVFYFGPGQGGPPRDNALRWAGQFQDDSGNPPEPRIEESDEGGRRIMRVFVEGTYAPSPMMGGDPQPPRSGQKLMGAIVEGPDANWFFKCTGPAATMDANRKAFDTMLASVS